MRTLFWAAALALTFVANGLCLRYLALAGVSYFDSLALRGAGCLLLVLLFARRSGLMLRPRSPATQFLRAAIAGLALSFVTLSYNWLTASAVSLLSRIDVPLLVLLGPVVGVQANRRVRALAFGAIGLLLTVVALLEPNQGFLRGSSALLVGTLLLCFGYLYIKKSMKEENEAVAILTPALALIAYGLGQRFLAPSPTPLPAPELMTLAFLAGGAAMFSAYYATMRLYEITDIATAEFPTLLSALALLPLEHWLLGADFSAPYLFLSFIFLFAVAAILRLRHQTQKGSV